MKRALISITFDELFFVAIVVAVLLLITGIVPVLPPP
jgi:hypothetical protein